MPSRETVINTAKTYINIANWSPINDTYNFGPISGSSGNTRLTQTFSSCFKRGGTYNVIPYVYGKPSPDQIPSPTQIRGKIICSDNPICPGGWDRASGKGTGRWQEAYRPNAMRNLAGIDCSQYVMKCLDFSTRRQDGTHYSALNISKLCLNIIKEDLKKGDFILKRGHIIIFNGWTDNQKIVANIFEARGLPEPEPPIGYTFLRRQFGQNDNIGCVVNQNVNVLGLNSANQVRISDRAGQFQGSIRGQGTSSGPFFRPHSIFPQFSFQRQSRQITVTVKGSGRLNIQRICLDGNVITSSCSVSGGNKQKTISCQISQRVTTGSHRIIIYATNSILGKTFYDKYDKSF